MVYSAKDQLSCRAETCFLSSKRACLQAFMGTSSLVLKLQRQTKLSIFFCLFLFQNYKRNQNCWDYGVASENKTIHTPITPPPPFIVGVCCCFLQVARTAAQYYLEQSRKQSLLAFWQEPIKFDGLLFLVSIAPLIKKAKDSGNEILHGGDVGRGALF